MEDRNRLNRRDFIRCAGAACGAAGLGIWPALARAAEIGQAGALAPKASHYPARADNLIVIFLSGGFSHIDTFDDKPKLHAEHGKVVPSVDLRGTSKQPLLGSPFKFQPYGKSGLSISELFPHLGGVADELCVIRGMNTDIVEHFQATLAMHTGSATVPLPSLGAWISYGLGTRNQNLPSYVVLAEQMPYGGSQVWDSNFLPPVHQGARIIPGDKPIADLATPARSVTLAEMEQLMLQDLNERHATARPDDLDLRARQQTFRTARGMMAEAPEVFDLRSESDATHAMYGLKRGDNKAFGWQCMVARRLIERQVRTVEVIHTGSNNNWDSHGNMSDHVPKARAVDQAIAALILDLKRRGLLHSTLIAICTEFGRTPWTDGSGTLGRNHYAKAFTCLLAGAGVKGGITYGETDDYGMKIVSNPCHVHDYHATILHLMGLDHTRLTYRYSGRDYRLTDVSGVVAKEILA